MTTQVDYATSAAAKRQTSYKPHLISRSRPGDHIRVRIVHWLLLLLTAGFGSRYYESYGPVNVL